MAVCLVGFLMPPWRAGLIKPGELSTPHAQILAGSLDSDRCQACHEQASNVGWFSQDQSGHDGVTQADRCLDCHHTGMPRSTAKFAHNLRPAIRNQLKLASTGSSQSTWQDWMPSEAVDQDDVQCSVCHKEHRGAQANLTFLSNQQCQTCHSQRFGSFADSHPDWNQWPYGRSGQISFNHATHQLKHFPAGDRVQGAVAFDCKLCHERQADGELTRSASYEQSCGSCHDASLVIDLAAGIDLVAMPSIPDAASSQIGGWPESATGFYDGRIAPMAQWLFRGEPELAGALASIPDQDFAKLDGGSGESIAVGNTIAKAHRQLLSQIDARGQSAIIDRLTRTGVDQSTASNWARSISPQLIGRASEVWFGDPDEPGKPLADAGRKPLTVTPARFPLDDDLLGDELTNDDLLSTGQHGDSLLGDDLLGDDLLGDNLLGDDPLMEDSLSVPDKSSDPAEDLRFDADRMLPAGGWYRDDLRVAIRYRGGGHADPVLRTTIEMASQLPVADPVRVELLNQRSVAACVQCHPGAIDGAADRRFEGPPEQENSIERWRSRPMVSGNQNSLDRRPIETQFTKFSHAPHLNIAGLSDCQHCHQVAALSGQTLASPGERDFHPWQQDFELLRRDQCSSCHTPTAAGDSCVKCHRYHIHEP